jgi:hypothetical protein
MADSPETAVDLSDEDIDAIVGELEDGDNEVTDSPASGSPALPSPDDANKAEDLDGGQEAGAGDQTDAELTPETTTPAVAAAPVPAPAPEVPLVEPPAGKPFQFRASGGVHTLPGALELPDGSIVIPKDAQPEFRNRLASERELAVNFKTLRREMTQKLRAAERTAADIKVESDAITALFADIQKMSPDERYEYFERFDQEIPKLKLEIEKKQLERERAALREERNPTPTEEEAKEAREAALQAELTATYTRVIAHPSIKALDPADVQAVFRKHAAKAERLVVKEADGSEVFDDAEVLEDLDILVKTAARVRAASTTGLGTTPTTAREKNEQRNADMNTIPPVVAARPPAPSGRKAEKAFKGDRHAFKHAFMEGALDDDE